MYVHIGSDISVPAHWIIGIFDCDQITLSEESVRFIAEAEASNRLDWLTNRVPRSVVVTMDRVYFTPVTTATLRARCYGVKG
ncbi:MAG: extracellular matrix regulator RemB [Saccharofermentanales bacterium]|jgi:hypothetical protein|nr:DUF370 domain-containing protein [Clostridiaceae bacterium]